MRLAGENENERLEKTKLFNKITKYVKEAVLLILKRYLILNKTPCRFLNTKSNSKNNLVFHILYCIIGFMIFFLLFVE
jgi:hypothetical protein